MRIIVHIGLPKTGTTFLQKQVFETLDEEGKLLYNPSQVMLPLKRFLRRTNCAIDLAFQEQIRRGINQFNEDLRWKNRVMLLSCEGITRNDLFQENNDGFKILKNLFPEAEIILFLRYQPKWIVSYYRQLIHEGHILMPFDEFLKHPQGDYRKIDYIDLCQNYFKHYGVERTHVFFFEDFEKDCEAVLTQLFKVLKCSATNDFKKGKKYNRGFSSRAIDLTLALKKILPMQHWMAKKQDFGIPIFEELWAERNQLSLLKRFGLYGYKVFKVMINHIQLWFSWRFFVQNLFDPLFYKDREFLKDDPEKAEEMRKFFVEQNIRLKRLLGNRQLPSVYID